MSIVPKALANGCCQPPPASDRPSPIQRNERAGERPITEEANPAPSLSRVSLCSTIEYCPLRRCSDHDCLLAQVNDGNYNLRRTAKAEASIVRKSKHTRTTMRLINTETLELHEFFESQAPTYAILSHTWDKDEITLQEMLSMSPSTMVKAGYKKIQDTCKMAQSRGQQWVWIDTCCIDKSSSAELTESINSMYRWYQNAHECYAYLVDFAPGSLPQDELEKCRWFTRGFTLQELIAPKTVVFFDRDWNVVGEKGDKNILEIIARFTGISEDLLSGFRPVDDYAIAERMLWASSRETTRPEDKAYCLLGIFEVNMPLIYGEGDNAFRRLQEEIIKRSNDLSIFAWGTPLNWEPTKKGSLTERRYLGLFARSPADFGATW
ncbi:heterokaryon incompatibility protein-domain-containing protein, partial [Neurospora hispaniola]